MTLLEVRKLRLDRMISLARVYRNWTSGQMKGALGRDATRATPASGNPKLDLLARLAHALEWEVGEVAESVWDEVPAINPTNVPVAEFGALDSLAQEQHRSGLFTELEITAREMRRHAANARERAVAANRLAGAYDGLGRYPRVLACVREGLAEQRIGEDLRMMLTVNLANAYYTLWNLQESQSLSSRLIDDANARASSASMSSGTNAASRVRRVGRAFCYAIRGHSERRLLTQCEGVHDMHRRAECAIADLSTAERLYDELAEDFGDLHYVGLANTARGGLLEARVAAGELSADDAVTEIIAQLEQAVDVEVSSSPHTLESWGWWSVFGANIALRAGTESARPLAEHSDHEQAIAICTNKAADIAEQLNSWPMRERAFTLDWFRRQSIAHAPMRQCRDWTLDGDDLRVLVGTMGRFPLFRPTGWQILEHAALVGSVA